jgi:hypothetical protein
MHAMAELREAFEVLVEGDDADSGLYRGVRGREPMGAREVLAALWNCSDIMPGDLCRSLDLPQGCTYAMGIGAFLSHQPG